MKATPDTRAMRRAVKAAKRALRDDAPALGAVIALDGRVIATGRGRSYATGHAVLEAIKKVPPKDRPMAPQMTCFSTLEPCVMCVAALLEMGVGRVVYGYEDPEFGGRALPAWRALPKGYASARWELKVSKACVQLGDHVLAARGQRELDVDPAEVALDVLGSWRDGGAVTQREARDALDRYAKAVPDDLAAEALPFASAMFCKTRTMADYRRLERFSKRAGVDAFLTEVDPEVRASLPDVWIKDALARGCLDDALTCWFENEGHKRVRHCEAKMIEVCGLADAELLTSCRMSTVDYLIGRGTRRHYIKACALLRKLRDELTRGGNEAYWPFVLQDLRERNSGRPALLDELDKAGFDALSGGFV